MMLERESRTSAGTGELEGGLSNQIDGSAGPIVQFRSARSTSPVARIAVWPPSKWHMSTNTAGGRSLKDAGGRLCRIETAATFRPSRELERLNEQPLSVSSVPSARTAATGSSGEMTSRSNATPSTMT